MNELIRAGKWTVPVLYEDNHLLCVEKPPNLPVQADASGDIDLLNILKNHIVQKYQKPGKAYVGLVHRLDRPVGGAMVFAKTSKAASRLSAQFSAHTARKIYLAVLNGEVRNAAEMRDFVRQNEKTGRMERAAETEDGAKEAALISTPIAVRDGLTLVSVRLLTGRKHQIRLQHALRGTPIWGDARYGGGKPGQQIALWARSLTFEHPTLKTPVTIASLPPKTGAWARFSEDFSISLPEIAPAQTSKEIPE